MEGCGFEIARLNSIRDDVLPPYMRWLFRRPVHKLFGVGAGPAVSMGSFFFYPWDYALLKAVKPAA